jgi:putative serine protease PepD
VLVVGATEGSPAAEAGILLGDVIVDIDGEPVDEPGDLLSELRTHDPGDRVELTLIRNGEEQTVEVVLGEGQLPEG